MIADVLDSAITSSQADPRQTGAMSGRPARYDSGDSCIDSPHAGLRDATLGVDPAPLPAGSASRPRQGDEGFVVLTGELDVTLGTEIRRLRAGEFIVVPAGTIHTFATVNDAPASVLVTMTPQIDALVRELHEVPEDERAAVWARYDSRPV